MENGSIMKKKYNTPKFDLLILGDDIIVTSGYTTEAEGLETNTDGSVDLPFVPVG